MRIGELSARSGVSARSLRYYEQQGFLGAERRSNGYRDYPEEAVSTARTIRSLYDLGLPSDLIRAVLPCATGETADQAVCDGVTERVAVIRDEIAARVTHLSRTRDTLTDFLNGQQVAVPGSDER